jgi:hypothetical protein
LILTESPERATEPITRKSTFNSFAISVGLFCLFLYSITESREIMRNALICANFVINESVIPSTKYSCESSPVRFLRGRTARELICGTTFVAFPKTQSCIRGTRHEAAAAVTSSAVENAPTNRAFLLPAFFCQLSRSICKSVRIAAAV